MNVCVVCMMVLPGALLTAFGLWALKRRRRRRQLEEQQQQQQHYKISFAPSVRSETFHHSNGLSGILPPGNSGSMSAFGLDSASDVHSAHSKSHGGRRR